MISAEQNERMTRIGPGTPAGNLLRNYWQPVALADELAGERPAKAVRLMGQDFVLFRDDKGRIGLLDRQCPHRGADLSFGRLEDGGLRCLFHGWLFDVSGQCIETPAEPEGSRMCEHIRQPSYPVAERSGIVFAWLGAGAPPAFPAFDCFVAPDAYTFAFKGLFACNWLQALEVGIDPGHASFLHRFYQDEDTTASYGRQFRSASSDSSMPMTRVLREYARPEIRVERAPYGMRLTALRKISDAQTHVRVTNLYFPQAFVIPMSAEMTITQWHVPVDDRSCHWYAIFTSFGGPVDKQKMREQRLQTYPLPDYVSRKNRANGWGYDPREQATETFTGMGYDINVHDQWACESMGAVQDRTKENLGSTDKAIVLYRRILNQAIDQNLKGETPLMKLDAANAPSITGPETIDGVGPTEGWDAYWKESVAKRRKGAAWAR
ncbi:MAG: aromatic ring-hydroxylating dioxygenase subunit alpha [Betaproteobacteria bacterium]|nr:aromatic ring-hydroxylating dioxygenase subunit alpha [Betaproteobacteria bacterium]